MPGAKGGGTGGKSGGQRQAGAVLQIDAGESARQVAQAVGRGGAEALVEGLRRGGQSVGEGIQKEL
jgi:hypothetical protein